MAIIDNDAEMYWWNTTTDELSYSEQLSQYAWYKLAGGQGEWEFDNCTILC